MYPKMLVIISVISFCVLGLGVSKAHAQILIGDQNAPAASSIVTIGNDHDQDNATPTPAPTVPPSGGGGSSSTVKVATPTPQVLGESSSSNVVAAASTLPQTGTNFANVYPYIFLVGLLTLSYVLKISWLKESE